MQNTYWNNNGKYEAESTALQELVPGMGAADTHKGEVMRAASKIYYDYFNNGWGNYWMNPAAFLITNIDLPENVRNALFEGANGNMHQGAYSDEMEEMINCVVEQLRDTEDRPNEVDMWEFEGDWELMRKFAEEYQEEDDWDDEEDYWSTEGDYEEDFQD